MKRRITVLSLALCPLLLTLCARLDAQQRTKIPRVGVLVYSTPEADPNAAAFRENMHALGYVEGKTFAIQYRAAQGKPERLEAAAKELVQLQPNVLLALGGDVVPAAQRATK